MSGPGLTQPPEKVYWLYTGTISVTIPENETCQYKMGLFKDGENTYTEGLSYVKIYDPKKPFVQRLQ